MSQNISCPKILLKNKSSMSKNVSKLFFASRLTIFLLQGCPSISCGGQNIAMKIICCNYLMKNYSGLDSGQIVILSYVHLWKILNKQDWLRPVFSFQVKLLRLTVWLKLQIN
jgi:hypothetical protein